MIMKIPLLDLKSQYKSIKNEIDAAIGNVLESQSFVLGEEVSKLEHEVADYCMAGHGVGVASGTDALILSLRALNIKSGDEVITTPLTFMATGGAVSIMGATPVFVDVDRDSYNIDPSLIESRITKKTKAIIPVHLFGQCADMDPILDMAKKHGLRVIEDCAQAIGALYKDKRAGSMGDIGGISFFPSKNLGAFGDGGMIVTNNKDIADKIKMLRVHGSRKSYYHDILGYNSRLDNLQAAVLRIKLKFLDNWIEKRQELAALYDSLLSDIDLKTPSVPEYTTHVYHLYIIATPRRDELFEYLQSCGIGARIYYPIPLHLQKCYKDLGYKRGDMPVSEKVSGETLAIPVYPELGSEGVEFVAGCIKKFFK